ncbi:MAG: SprT-like domain-containing protein [Candidatus Cloacimonetes bacterium]|nr:SprT-like domain-containing protein [Candidatus Cloacimonadota bacterium]
MNEKYELNRDIIPDNKISQDDVNNLTNDFGGDLATDAGVDLNNKPSEIENKPEIHEENNLGVDLNKFSKDYTYDDYLESGEVQNPLEVESPPETKEYTGSEYTDFNKTQYNDKAPENQEIGRWSDMTLDEQKLAMNELANDVIADTGMKNPPEIVFSGDMGENNYGGYNQETNIIEINENMLDDGPEAADTIAHEMWHAYQYECSQDPSNPRGAEYQEGFENYITPDMDFEAYENQMVEAEARDFAAGYRDRFDI